MDFALEGMETRTLSEKGAPMTVRDLDGKTLNGPKGKPVTITLLGTDSAKYRSLSRKQVRARMQAMAAGDAEPLTPEQEEQAVVDLLAACTVSWDNLTDTAGNPIPCTPENAGKLYTAYPAIRDQADGFISRRQNFIKAS